MKKFVYLAALLLLAFVPYVTAGDEPGQHGADQELGPESTMEKSFDRVIDELKLTGAQEQKLHEIRESSKRDIFSLRNEMHIAVWDIQDELKKESSDNGKINSAIDRLTDAQKKLIKLRTDQMLKTKQILTPEQFKKLILEMEKHKVKSIKKVLEKTKQ